MYLHLLNHNDEILHSNLPTPCKGCMEAQSKRIDLRVCHLTKGKRRSAKAKTKDGSVYFCGDEELLLKARRIVIERLRVYSEMLPELEQARRAMAHNVSKHLRRLMHNLTSQNAHNMQDIYDVAPQEALSGAMSDQLDYVQRALRQDPTKAARAFLRINKHNTAMKCEFSAFKFLYESSTPPLKNRTHKIRKVVLNALHLFYQDLKEKNVKLDVISSEASVRLDYECLQVALYHLIDNAAKYVLNGSNMIVSFPVEHGHQLVRFDMTSLEITDIDYAKMFEDGYSGQHPKRLGLAGAGLGLGIVRDLLRLIDGKIAVHRNIKPERRQCLTMGTYEFNRFDITLGRPS